MTRRELLDPETERGAKIYDRQLRYQQRKKLRRRIREIAREVAQRDAIRRASHV
jgi:hypothetical protein